MASGSWDNMKVRIWNGATGECMQTLHDSDRLADDFMDSIAGHGRFDFGDSAHVVGVSMDGASKLQIIDGAEGLAAVCTGAVPWQGNSVHLLVPRGGRVQR